MISIHWLPGARNDLQRLHRFIHAHSPAAAVKAVDSIIEAIDHLGLHPEIGKPWDVDINFREWPVQFGAKGYVIRYRLFEDKLFIVRIWHGLENREPD